ncbi:MAG: lysine--tRNA ligase [Candidatus Altiarchaeales archaeon]|nr:MAG: lysine--tRNA ligase [Candidatus Altiarchaeales archaeon]
MEKSLHWTDRVVEKLLRRGNEHVIETGTSISGIPHIGNASDVIRGDAIRKVLEEKNSRVKFIWVADDSDPFRRVPGGMESLRDYLGFPVHDIPDPFGCHNNFVEHFVEKFLSELKEFGVEPRAYSSTELYRSGELYDEIKIALRNSEKIREILNEFRKEPLPREFVPWQPICENCGRISTPRVYSVDDDIVCYKCEDTEVSDGRVRGCGFKGESDIREGRGKLIWRVEWAARWSHFRVTCEPLGKEHASAGGSFWTSKRICKEIYNWEPPLPVIYEFFTLNKEKISSSKGNVITLSDWLKICEPEVLKFFMYKKLQKQRDINLRKIPNLVDEYDLAERIYFGLENDSYEMKRMYELSQINEPRSLQVPFTLCAVLSQIVEDLNINYIVKRLKRLGYDKFDLGRLKRRLIAAKNWNDLYGPDYLKFKLISPEEAMKIKKNLSEKQRIGLRRIYMELEKEKGIDAKTLHKRIYEISREIGLKPELLFDAIYLVLIGKKRGPRAALFLLGIDRKIIRERFFC